ncbi:kinetochore protein NDC80, partial [Tanacetum coccineum]
MEETEKQLRVKVEERNMICAENEELKKKVEVLSFNMRYAERMKRELQAVERDIGEAEIERNKCEEKCWDLNAVIGTKWKEHEAFQLECNQAIRRCKIGNLLAILASMKLLKYRMFNTLSNWSIAFGVAAKDT